MKVAEAREYINYFLKNVFPENALYVEFPSGRIYFDNMTDEQAIKVAIGLLEIEASANKDNMQ